MTAGRNSDDIYNFEDVMNVLNYEYHNYTTEEKQCICPACGGKNCYINFRKNIGKCYGSKSSPCNMSWNPTLFYSYVMGVDTKEAYKQLVEYKEGNLVLGNRKVKPKASKPVTEYEEVLPIADDLTLHKVYTALKNMLPLTERDLKDLKARGFTEREINYFGYKSYTGRYQLETATALQRKGFSLKNIPGFYESKDGWEMKHLKSGFFMFIRNEKNQIVGAQIRKHNEVLRKDEKKCNWFSSPGEHNGTKRSAICHFATDFYYDLHKDEYVPYFPDGVVYFTEGPLKGDIIHLVEKIPVIALPGTSSYKSFIKLFPLLKESGVKKVINYFDMDYITNANVKKHSDLLEHAIKDFGFEYERPVWETHIPESEKLLKGRDDYDMYHYRHVIPN